MAGTDPLLRQDRGPLACAIAMMLDRALQQPQLWSRSLTTVAETPPEPTFVPNPEIRRLMLFDALIDSDPPLPIDQRLVARLRRLPRSAWNALPVRADALRARHLYGFTSEELDHAVRIRVLLPVHGGEEYIIGPEASRLSDRIASTRQPATFHMEADTNGDVAGSKSDSPILSLEAAAPQTRPGGARPRRPTVASPLSGADEGAGGVRQPPTGGGGSRRLAGQGPTASAGGPAPAEPILPVGAMGGELLGEPKQADWADDE